MKYSFTSIPAARLLAACEAYLLDREAKAANERQKLVNSLVGRRFWPWSAPFTEQTAELHLQQPRFNPDRKAMDASPWHQVTASDEHSAQRVSALLSLARVAGKGSVGLVADDALLLEHYLLD
jgi:hypothetical protein